MLEEKDIVKVENNQLKDIADQIVNANTAEEVNDLTNAFILAHIKKDALRSATLSDLRDDLIEQLKKRVANKPDEMNNRDLIDFINIISAQEDKAKENVINPKKEPSLTIVDNSITINNNEEKISAESRKKIIEVIKYLTEGTDNSDIIDAEVEEINKGD